MRKIVKTVTKEIHDKSIVCFDIPTLIRVLEYVRETLKSDDEVHVFSTKILELCEDGSVINMKHLTEIIL